MKVNPLFPPLTILFLLIFATFCEAEITNYRLEMSGVTWTSCKTYVRAALEKEFKASKVSIVPGKKSRQTVTFESEDKTITRREIEKAMGDKASRYKVERLNRILSKNLTKFPAHWGAPPSIETSDYRKLPRDYGYGSSTLFEWIKKNIKRDIERDLDPVDGKWHLLLLRNIYPYTQTWERIKKWNMTFMT